MTLLNTPSQATPSPEAKREIVATEVFWRNAESTEQVLANIGGARSTKSHSIAQLLIGRASNASKRKVAVMRKTGPALRRTARRLVIDLLKDYGYYNEKDYHRADSSYEFNGGTIDFLSLDETSKIKSSEFNDVWLEEADEFTWDDFVTIKTRLSAASKIYRNQIYLSFNPCDSNSWIHDKLRQMPDVKFIHSTYRDNPFLSEDYIKTLLALKEIDPVYFQIFAEGQWGMLTDLIYSFNLVDKLPDSYDFAIRGLDFGFNNPSSLVKIVVKDGKPFAREELYQAGLTNTMLIEELKRIIPNEQRGDPIYADAAEPARISEIANAGFNVLPADKEVVPGILSVKSSGMSVTKDSTNIIKEAKVYKWMKDRNGKVFDQPVKFMDHSMDGIRYAWHTHNKGLGNQFLISVSGGT